MIPDVAVVIPAYNIAPLIGETLASVLRQEETALEVVVVDDGSADGTSEAVAAVPDRRIDLVRSRNRGVSAARNLGLERVRAPLVLFLDGDDLLAPDALRRLRAALEAAPRAPAAFGRHAKFTDTAEGRRWIDPPPRPLPRSRTLAHLLERNFVINPGNLLCRTGAARAAGGFDPGLRMGEDWEFFCRLAQQGDFAVADGAPVLYYRQRVDGANHAHRGSPFRQHTAAIDRIFANPALDAAFSRRELRRRRRQALSEQYWSAARMELWQRRRLRFLAFAAVGVVRHPWSLLRPDRIRAFVRSSRWSG